MTIPNVRVRPARSHEIQIIENLIQYYVYDFSEIVGDGPRQIDFGALGRYDTKIELAPYWSEPNAFPFLIHCDECLAGFALINTNSHHGGSVERNMAEFFVARRHRRRGVATMAVHQILAHLPGQWEVAVMSTNFPAQAFWPGALSSSPVVSDLNARPGDGINWSGPIWSFRTIAR